MSKAITCLVQLVTVAVCERGVAAVGLNLLLEMLQSFQHSDFATQFHKTYYLTLMQEIFAVMTGMQKCLHQLCGGACVYPVDTTTN